MSASTVSAARPDRLGRATIAFYALPGLALAAPTIPAYVLLPSYYAELGLGLALTGLILFAARALDVLSDPLAGWLCDRFDWPGGRHRTLIAIGALLAGPALIMLFAPPATVTPGYLLLWAVVLYVGWTLINVPYIAWAADLATGYHERTRLTAAREACMLFGLLLAAALPALAAQAGLARSGQLLSTAVAACLIGVVTIPLLLRNVPETGNAVRAGSARHGFSLLLRNGPFVRLLAAWFVNGLANGIPAVTLPIFLVVFLQADADALPMFVLLYFLAGIVAVPGWLWLSRRLGKHTTWCLAMLSACVVFAAVPLLTPGDLPAFAVICLLSGLALGADLTLPPAMQADVVDWDRLRFRQERPATLFALWSMATKLALGASVGLAFPLLQAFGVDAAGDNGTVQVLAVALIYAAMPVVLKLIAVALVWRYPITAQRHAAIQRRLGRSTAVRQN